MEEIEEFKYVWVDRKLRGNVQLEKMAKIAEERIGRVTWMSRVNEKVGASSETKYGVCTEVWWTG